MRSRSDSTSPSRTWLAFLGSSRCCWPTHRAASVTPISLGRWAPTSVTCRTICGSGRSASLAPPPVPEASWRTTPSCSLRRARIPTSLLPLPSGPSAERAVIGRQPLPRSRVKERSSVIASGETCSSKRSHGRSPTIPSITHGTSAVHSQPPRRRGVRHGGTRGSRADRGPTMHGSESSPWSMVATPVSGPRAWACCARCTGTLLTRRPVHRLPARRDRLAGVRGHRSRSPRCRGWRRRPWLKRAHVHDRRDVSFVVGDGHPRRRTRPGGVVELRTWVTRRVLAARPARSFAGRAAMGSSLSGPARGSRRGRQWRGQPADETRRTCDGPAGLSAGSWCA